MDLHPNVLADILTGRAAFCELCKKLGEVDCHDCKVAKLTKKALGDESEK